MASTHWSRGRRQGRTGPHHAIGFIGEQALPVRAGGRGAAGAGSRALTRRTAQSKVHAWRETHHLKVKPPSPYPHGNAESG